MSRISKCKIEHISQEKLIFIILNYYFYVQTGYGVMKQNHPRVYSPFPTNSLYYFL